MRWDDIGGYESTKERWAEVERAQTLEKRALILVSLFGSSPPFSAKCGERLEGHWPFGR